MQHEVYLDRDFPDISGEEITDMSKLVSSSLKWDDSKPVITSLIPSEKILQNSGRKIIILTKNKKSLPPYISKYCKVNKNHKDVYIETIRKIKEGKIKQIKIPPIVFLKFHNIKDVGLFQKLDIYAIYKPQYFYSILQEVLKNDENKM